MFITPTILTVNRCGLLYIEVKDQAKLYTGTECDVTASQSIVLAIVLNEQQVRYVRSHNIAYQLIRSIDYACSPGNAFE